MKALLSSTYFGPIQWYQKLNRYDECLIERHESFIKQTYRNRMIIPTTNGPLSLTIPTNHNTSLAMKDIRISDHANWRHVHWNALLSAYGESPFSSITRTISAPSSKRNTSFSSISIWKLQRR